MIRIRLFGVLFAFVLAAMLGTHDTVVQSQTRPNIVVIMADDLDVGTFSTAVARGLLPNIKSNLVDVGQVFSESFVTTTQAASTRATFLTGQYPHNHGVRGSLPPLGGVTLFNANSTVGTWLRTAGYNTGYVGRYLLGYGSSTDPTMIPPGWNFWAATIDPSTYSTSEYQFNVQGSLVPASAFEALAGAPLHQTDANAILAGFYLSQQTGSQPFFLSVNPYVPNYEVPTVNECPTAPESYWGGNIWGVTIRPALRHYNTVFGDLQNFPLPQPPSFNETDVSDKPAWMNGNPLLTTEDIDCLQRAYWRRLESLRGLDDLVGHLVNKLQATGKLSNTVIMLSSDNGFMNGHHRLTQKGSPHEAAVRVPLVIRLPGNLTPRVIGRLVTNVDLAPTIAQLAGATATRLIDGRSLVTLFNNPNATWRKLFLIEHYEQLVIEPFAYPPPFGTLRIISPAHKMYTRYAGAPADGELYDLVSDPYELENRFRDPLRQAEAAALDQWLAAMATCSGSVCRLLEQLFAVP
jgi:N-acetylglucosamine-6-sulfatase